MDNKNYGHTPVKIDSDHSWGTLYWYYYFNNVKKKVELDWHTTQISKDMFPYRHRLTLVLINKGNPNIVDSAPSPILINPFQVEHNGEIIFTLTDPEWIAKITEAILKQ